MRSFYSKIIKNLIDFFAAIFLLVITLPIILITILALILSQGKFLFTQPRIGLDNKEFQIYKFKTMNDKVDENGALLPDAQRLTAVGKFVRKTSMDELPQLINIIKGEMSFIGPRPLLVDYLPYYTAEQIRRHDVKPGITGWAQVNGRNAISWEKKFEFDLYYINHQSFLLDLKISLLSVLKIVKSEGIQAEGHATMPRFSDYMEEKYGRD